MSLYPQLLEGCSLFTQYETSHLYQMESSREGCLSVLRKFIAVTWNSCVNVEEVVLKTGHLLKGWVLSWNEMHFYLVFSQCQTLTGPILKCLFIQVLQPSHFSPFLGPGLTLNTLHYFFPLKHYISPFLTPFFKHREEHHQVNRTKIGLSPTEEVTLMHSCLVENDNVPKMDNNKQTVENVRVN